MLNKNSIKLLKDRKNLLAFSGGVDSTALFFLLLDTKIEFDIAIVNYGVRDESILEVEYAKELAQKYKKEIFILDAPKIQNGSFEAKAREIRYNFFKELVDKYNYSNLLTAHQLNDRFEWMMMQFVKGAGLIELNGIQDIETRDNFNIIRPLLNITKDDLENYLNQNSIKYFIDKSNFDEKYHRNSFRKVLTPILNQYSDGIKNSFEYLLKDTHSLLKDSKQTQIEELTIIESSNDDNIDIRIIDIELKKRGVLLSKKQREEILDSKDLVVSHKVVVTFHQNRIFIAPYIKTSIPKKIKDIYRVNKIPQKIRAYIYRKDIDIKLFLN